MKENKNSTIIGLALLIAIVVSIVTASITGNVIKVSKGLYGPVYTTAEIDARLRNVATYEKVLNILTNSTDVNPYNIGSVESSFLADGKTPNQYCQEKGNGNCILVFNDFNEVYFNSNNLTCSNRINYNDRSNLLNFPANCNTVFNEQFYTNWYDPRPNTARCIGGGYGDSDHWSTYSVRFICAKR